ncbi:MAG: cadherin-like domain-containing protein, partial [Bacteroidetes bacterium]|nr:cadherin-like domain-containing protein [Bacteroidota bacterium]
VKNYLQDHCWQFVDFDVNRNGWTPGIEGDGAMVSGPGNSATETTGIYSQQLSIWGHVNISFSYQFSANVTDRRWINIYLTDGANNILSKLDSVELTGAAGATTYHFNKSYGAGSRCYRVYIQYQGIGGNNPIAIDELSFDAPTCYSTGCNQAPVAENDTESGSSDHTANGYVLPNDHDEDPGTSLTAQLVTNSPDGTVTLYGNGYFTFVPNAGFTGTTTSFTYMACDNGTPSLCSAPATVTITFPLNLGSLPVTIVDLAAAYNDNIVQVKWTTTFEQNNDRFEIERSTDGITFKTVGTVKGQGNSGVRHDYEFDDEVKRNTVSKNDLYYRLKQVDLDGKATYSKILVVRVYQTKSLQSVSVTPNPAVNDIRVNVQLNENSYIVIKVINSAGTEIMRKAVRGTTGANKFTMDGSSQLQTGVYFLEVIINSNERMMVKLVKS